MNASSHCQCCVRRARASREIATRSGERLALIAGQRGTVVARLITASPEATDAVHAFLLFQIVDHQTGDVPTISDDPLKT
jgi:hypothetical protein